MSDAVFTRKDTPEGVVFEVTPAPQVAGYTFKWVALAGAGASHAGQQPPHKIIFGLPPEAGMALLNDVGFALGLSKTS